MDNQACVCEGENGGEYGIGRALKCEECKRNKKGKIGVKIKRRREIKGVNEQKTRTRLRGLKSGGEKNGGIVLLISDRYEFRHSSLTRHTIWFLHMDFFFFFFLSRSKFDSVRLIKRRSSLVFLLL